MSQRIWHYVYHVVFLVICIGACMCCADGARPRVAVGMPIVHDPRIVKVDGWCPGHDNEGSGVLISPRLALSVWHAVTFCGYATRVTVTSPSGDTQPATIERAWPERDTIILELTHAVPFESLRLAAPSLHEHLCGQAAAPHFNQICGFVGAVAPKSCNWGFCSDLTLPIGVVGGNSGTGLFDDWGGLVALVTGGRLSRDGVPSYAMSVWDIRAGIAETIARVRSEP